MIIEKEVHGIGASDEKPNYNAANMMSIIKPSCRRNEYSHNDWHQRNNKAAIKKTGPSYWMSLLMAIFRFWDNCNCKSLSKIERHIAKAAGGHGSVTTRHSTETVMEPICKWLCTYLPRVQHRFCVIVTRFPNSVSCRIGEVGDTSCY